ETNMAEIKYVAYQIIPTNKTDEDGKPIAYWNRIGAAFRNKDDSLNVPLDGRIHLREPKAKTNDVAPLAEEDFNDGIPF
ncbi:MAG: hypothetical protein ACR2RB_04240, partial [Gammaproteobacteria bacterium]